MKPAKFDYVRAESTDEAVALLAEYGDDARILAGGQSLMPMLNMRLTQPQILIDISQASDLNFVRVENGALHIGAATTPTRFARARRQHHRYASRSAHSPTDQDHLYLQ